VKEADIRPEDLLQRFLELCREDAVRLFQEGPRRDIPCPACGSGASRPAFEKWGFGYRECGECSSLFQSPRPEPEQFARFYRESESSRYWARTVFPAVAEARREKLFRPKAARAAELCRQAGLEVACLADVGAGQGVFLESWRERFPDCRCVAVEPHPDHAGVCRDKGFEVAECFAEDADGIAGRADLAVALEVLEHVHDPLAFCRCMRGVVRPGGRVLLTGLCGDGFDIRVLWDRSRSVSPPQHINFPYLLGAVRLLERAGFEAVEVFTPGRLDVDIVRKAAAQDPGVLEGQRFTAALMDRDEATLERFQDFLADNGLSSHLWLWARRPA
jgi:SAM-dependent methyltransferase